MAKDRPRRKNDRTIGTGDRERKIGDHSHTHIYLRHHGFLMHYQQNRPTLIGLVQIPSKLPSNQAADTFVGRLSFWPGSELLCSATDKRKTGGTRPGNSSSELPGRRAYPAGSEVRATASVRADDPADGNSRASGDAFAGEGPAAAAHCEVVHCNYCSVRFRTRRRAASARVPRTQD
jgi:hypothetical protein